ncbi:MAG: hypothetical protein FWD69_19305 [Polyangiaceae bacterium]|nr:hypothetical protein [Polyangiaceae bacterium]
MSIRSSRATVVSGLAVGACLVLHPVVARAQETIAINPTYVTSNGTSLPRLGSDGNQVTKRGLNFNPEGVSLQDCLDDQSIRFPLTLMNFVANASLQVWASADGDDCTQQTARSGGVQTCWQLVSGVPLSTNPIVDIPVRAIMSGVLSATSPDASQSVCGTIPRSTVAVNFLYFDPGNVATASANVAVTIAVNTIGPDAPTGLMHVPGNQRIYVSWDAIGEGGINAVTGVKVYCDPLQSTSNDASTDADACFSSNFVNASGTSIIPSANFDSKFECGSIAGNTSNSVVASSVDGQPLVNGETYAVALAATDDFQNAGPLSAVQCETPDAGGGEGEGAGAGGCSVNDAGVPTGSTSILGIMSMLAFCTIRRIGSRTRNDQ